MKKKIALLAILAISMISAVKSRDFTPSVSECGFVENKGQIVDQNGRSRPDVDYLYTSPGSKIAILNNGYSYELYETIKTNKETNEKDEFIQSREEHKYDIKIKYHRVDAKFLAANPECEIIAKGKSSSYTNYYLPGTPESGVLDVRSYNTIIYKNFYPGIDLVYKCQEAGKNVKVKYDLRVRPEGNLSNVKIAFEGANQLSLNESGELVISTAFGDINESIPSSFYISKTDKSSSQSIEKTEVGYKLEDNVLSFIPKENKSNRTLIVDPELFWGSYYGGAENDKFYETDVDSKDNIYITGVAQSSTRIATSGAHLSEYQGDIDGMLVKFNNQCERQWATYYGGSNHDTGIDVIVTYRDSILIGGNTRSFHNIATNNAYQSSFGGGSHDGYIAKFNGLGRRLWGTYYGGDDADFIYGIALDSNQNLFAVGKTNSLEDIATEDGYQSYKEGSVDAFVVKFDSTMNRVWGTYFGGNDFQGSDVGRAIAADRTGNCYFTGYTCSDFSIANDNAFQKEFGGGGYDAFITKLYPNGNAHWASYYGGDSADYGRGIATYGNGKVYLVGVTRSDNNIADTNGYRQQRIGGYSDIFIVKFDIYGDRKWGTYYGGTGTDYIHGVCKYKFDQCLVLGATDSEDSIATSGEHQTSLAGDFDSFVINLDTDGDLQWGTYYGGSRKEKHQFGGVASDSKANIIISGYTNSSDNISTPYGHQPTFIGDSTFDVDPDTGDTVYTYWYDAFVAMLGTRITINQFDDVYCSGKEIDVPFTVGLDFLSGNQFTLELSDSTGDFSDPFEIGTLTGTGSGVISGLLDTIIPPGNHYRIRITASNPENTSQDNGFDITVAPLPEPVIQGDSVVCSRNNYNYSVYTESGATNQWFIEGGKIIGDSTLHEVEVVWEDGIEGSLKVIQTIEATGCIDSTQYDVEIIVSPKPTIAGDSSVTAYTTGFYSAPSVSSLEYDWTIIGGTIVGDTTDNRIQIDWGGPGVGYVKLKITDTFTNCSDTVSFYVTINSSPLRIQGVETPCENTEELYWIRTEDSSATSWSVNGGEIIAGEDEDSVRILWKEAGEGFVEAVHTDTAENKSDTVVKRVEILEAPETPLLGTEETCEGITEVYYTENDDGFPVKWSVYNGEIIGDADKDTVEVEWNNIAPEVDSSFVLGSITLEVTNPESGCVGTKTKSSFISKNPSADFLGRTSVCAGRVETYFAKEKDVLINEWVVEGGTILGSAKDSVIQVEWGEVGVGSIKLTQTNSSQCTDSSKKDIVINSVPPKPEITQSGKILYSSADEGNQWFVNGNKIQEATNKFFMPDSSGYYTVQVTNEKNCKSDMSAPYFFETKVIDFNASRKFLKIYPNPTEGVISIEIKRELRFPATLEIKNIVGRKVAEYALEKSKSIDIGSLPSGSYIINVKVEGLIYAYKIIKI